MGEFVHILLLVQLSDNFIMTPGWPMVAVKQHCGIGFRFEEVGNMADIITP